MLAVLQSLITTYVILNLMLIDIQIRNMIMINIIIHLIALHILYMLYSEASTRYGLLPEYWFNAQAHFSMKYVGFIGLYHWPIPFKIIAKGNYAIFKK